MKTLNLLHNDEQIIPHVNQVPPFDSKVSEEEAFTSKEDETSQFFKKIEEIEDKIKLLDSEFYVLINPQEIKEFLFGHEHLFDFLFEAKDRITEYFKHSVEGIYLELQQDPEEDFEQLFLLIETKLPADQAVSILNKVDEDWWLNMDIEIRRYIEIDVETRQ